MKAQHNNGCTNPLLDSKHTSSDVYLVLSLNLSVFVVSEEKYIRLEILTDKEKSPIYFLLLLQLFLSVRPIKIAFQMHFITLLGSQKVWCISFGLPQSQGTTLHVTPQFYISLYSQLFFLESSPSPD